MVETFDCTKFEKEKDWLVKGSKGADVKLLQTHLKSLGYYTTYNGHTLKIDGDFGKHTYNAVVAFQRAIGGLQPDGKFGQATCKKLNQKLLPNNTTTTTSTKTSANTPVNTTSKANISPYAPNPKNNVIPETLQNISVDGIYLVASSVTRTNAVHGGNWKSIELMNGKNFIYQGRPSPREYSVDCYFNNTRYGKIFTELDKMTLRVCQVVTKLFPSGKYVISVSVADDNRTSKKVTLKFMEYMV